MIGSQVRERVSAAGAMAVLWAFFFNARLFPISLANDSYGTLAPLTLYLVYGLSLVIAGVCAVFLELQPRGARYRRPCALVGGAVGLAGSAIVVFPYGGFSAATLMIGLGTGAMALFLVAQFWYWTAHLRGRDPATALVDAALGLALFAAGAAPAALLHAESPVAFALLPLISLACTALSPSSGTSSRGDLGKPLRDADGSVPGESDLGALSLGIIRRVLVPSVIYLYLVQAMNVALDGLTLLPLGPFRPWVFVFVTFAVAVLVLGLLRSGVSPVKRLAQSFNIVSAFLLAALFVTCCQTVGLLPVGNYAVVAAKILLCFFIWILVVLRPAVKGRGVRCVVLLALYLLLVLWLPNLVQSIILAVHPTLQTPGQLSWLFLVLSGIALAISVGSNATISSLITGDPAAAPLGGAPMPAAGGKADAGVANSTAVDSLGSHRADAVAEFRTRYGLSDREAEITRFACEGKTAKRIARELFIAESTVYTHLKHIYRKAGVHSKQELVDAVEGSIAR